MSDYIQTAEALDRMAVQQQALIDAASVFRQLGSIEGATKEANDRRTEAESLLATAVESLAKARNDELLVREQISAQLTDANIESDRLIANAQLDATRLVDAARVDAENIRLAAQTQADKLIVDTNEDLVSVRAELEEVRALERAAQENLIGLNTAAADAQARLDAVRASIMKLAQG